MSKEIELPLKYLNIKKSQFVGKWNQISHVIPNIYRKIIDTIHEKIYDHPYVTNNGLTTLAPYLVIDGRHVSFSDVQTAIIGGIYINLNTIDGNYLIVAKADDMLNDQKLATKIYNILAKNTPVYAIRPVIPSDRQIHWVWFRKSPTYKLTEEIVLRAASWIELNPGYTFNLWTNLKDQLELDDFLSDLPTSVRNRYFSGIITVHYESEFRTCVFSWVKEHIPELLPLYTEVWNSRERHNIVMKTDYSRNILLAVHGGIYTDFNDLLCLAPIEPVLEAHAGKYIGVTDNTNQQNASNYFMYAGKDCPEWLDLTIRCTRTMISVHAMIYDNTSLETARMVAKDMADGNPPNLATIQQSIAAAFPYNLEQRHFVFAIAFGIAHNITTSESLAKDLQPLVSRGKFKKNYIELVILVFQKHSTVVKNFVDSADFGVAWRFGRTDMYLGTIMHRCNLPIFAREQKTPITLLPFSYLLRYSNMLSFVGHLGDGTSFGRDAQNKITIKKILEV